MGVIFGFWMGLGGLACGFLAALRVAVGVIFDLLSLRRVCDYGGSTTLGLSGVILVN